MCIFWTNFVKGVTKTVTMDILLQHLLIFFVSFFKKKHLKWHYSSFCTNFIKWQFSRYLKEFSCKVLSINFAKITLCESKNSQFITKTNNFRRTIELTLSVQSFVQQHMRIDCKHFSKRVRGPQISTDLAKKWMFLSR